MEEVRYNTNVAELERSDIWLANFANLAALQNSNIEANFLTLLSIKRSANLLIQHCTFIFLLISWTCLPNFLRLYYRRFSFNPNLDELFQDQWPKGQFRLTRKGRMHSSAKKIRTHPHDEDLALLRLLLLLAWW